ncbi:hypothetical protein KC19_5G136700 [Ceratodon purpureus]|uniref:Uncharacterized protein n=1 Tax=Ceratodon purpureus TaxID=3225 RepID=A0A8T0I225_CERPU|nr:hypothetical protein KC19_5G136700 [Ceratodon purpureus]
MASRNIWEGVFSRYKPASSFWEIRKVQRGFRYAGLYVLFAGVTYFYTNISTRAGVPRINQTYSSYPAGTDILFDATELYKSAIGNIFEEEDWGPLEYAIMAKHFERQGKSPYMYHSQYMTHLLSNGQLKGPS